jgi:TonB family protein
VPPKKPAKVPPKPVPKKPAKKPANQWRARTAEEILKTANLSTPPKRPTRTASTDPDKIRAQLAKGLHGRKVRPVVVSGGRPAQGAVARYYDAVSAALYGLWDQPSRAEVGGGRPTVTASITVDADGRVSRAGLSRGSGTRAMDASVVRVLKDLARLPPLRDYGITARTLAISVQFELD